MANSIIGHFTIAGVLVLAIGGHQYMERSKLGYQVQKDARNLAIELFSDDAFRATLETGVFDEAATRKLWQGFNFYSSAYRLARRGALPDEQVRALAVDFCDFVTTARISAKWNEMVARKQLGPIHIQMRAEWCWR